MKLVTTFFILSIFVSCTQKKKPININTPDNVIHVTKKEYLSVALDTAQIVGSYWWDTEGEMMLGRGKNKTSPLNLNLRLSELLKELSPTYLRIGGSEADALFYNIKGDRFTPNTFDSELNASTWKKLLHFTEQSNAKLFFTLNIGPSSWIDNQLDFSNLEYFFQNIKTPTDIEFELGNEVFAYWAIFGSQFQMTPKQYADYYLKTKKLLKENKLKTNLAGPASAYWPVIGEPLGFYFHKMDELHPLLKEKLSRITWHYYPTQSFRCPLQIRKAHKKSFLNPVILDEIKKWAKEQLILKEKYSPNSELWLGETGPAQCGGEPNVSDTFLSSFWWVDQLGTLAQLKHDVIIRQNLIGADYALVNSNYSLRPDYIVSWLWKKLMGTKVLKPQNKNENSLVRIYSHCHPTQNSITTLLINLESKKQTLKSINNSPTAQVFAITTNQLSSQRVMINNSKIVQLSDLKNLPASDKKFPLDIAPYSINFIQTSPSGFSACR